MTPDHDPATLAAQDCARQTKDSPALPEDEVARLATGLEPAWRVGPDRLVREFRFGSFGPAFAFATRIALLAEGQDHHPTVEVAWGRLTVAWTTDVIGGLTGNDFIMAAKVDRMVARGLAIREG